MLNIRWLNPRSYQILQTRYKYLRVAEAFKNQFSSEKTYSCKRDLKGLCHTDFAVFWSKLLRHLTKNVSANMKLLAEHRQENIKEFLQGRTNYN